MLEKAVSALKHLQQHFAVYQNKIDCNVTLGGDIALPEADLN